MRWERDKKRVKRARRNQLYSHVEKMADLHRLCGVTTLFQLQKLYNVESRGRGY
jgi:hypothetical protein